MENVAVVQTRCKKICVHKIPMAVMEEGQETWGEVLKCEKKKLERFQNRSCQHVSMCLRVRAVPGGSRLVSNVFQLRPPTK